MGTNSGINLKIGHYYLISDIFGKKKQLAKVIFKSKHRSLGYYYKLQFKKYNFPLFSYQITYAKEIKNEEEIVFELI